VNAKNKIKIKAATIDATVKHLSQQVPSKGFNESQNSDMVNQTVKSNNLAHAAAGNTDELSQATSNFFEARYQPKHHHNYVSLEPALATSEDPGRPVSDVVKQPFQTISDASQTMMNNTGMVAAGGL